MTDSDLKALINELKRTNEILKSIDLCIRIQHGMLTEEERDMISDMKG